MTMLIVDYKSTDKSYNIESKSFIINTENLSEVVDFVLKTPRESGCSEKTLNEIAICIDEIFANLDMHAFPDGAEKRIVDVTTTIWENHLKISFADEGVAFNPLETDIYKATEGARLHRKGGLGIFLIKKMTDAVYYKYTNTHNILTIIKTLDKSWK